MTIQTTRFEPDTCACIIEYTWDDTTPEDQRLHTLSAIVRKGPEHAAILDASLMTVVLEENRRKNVALGIVASVNSALTPRWAFTPGRALDISFPSPVPANIKTQIQNACDLQFGPGNVQVI